MLAPITDEALEIIAEYAPIVEIGAGGGQWAKALELIGVDIVAYDVCPRGLNVLMGDHKKASEHDGTMLAVWPPDGSIIQQWIDVKPWKHIIIIGSQARLRYSTSYQIVKIVKLPGGRKGSNELYVYKR